MATVYEISSANGEKKYIGSTTDFDKRKKNHHTAWKQKKTCTSGKLFDEYGFENCVFTILEVCALEERRVRERFHLMNTEDAVNRCIPGRTKKEYDEDNKEDIRQKKHLYYELHKEKDNKRTREYRQLHKDELNKKRREKYLQKKLTTKKCNREVDQPLQYGLLC